MNFLNKSVHKLKMQDLEWEKIEEAEFQKFKEEKNKAKFMYPDYTVWQRSKEAGEDDSNARYEIEKQMALDEYKMKIEQEFFQRIRVKKIQYERRQRVIHEVTQAKLELNRIMDEFQRQILELFSRLEYISLS